MTLLISAGRFLTPEITARYPRLDLLSCLILCLSSRRPEAAARFEAISQRTDGFARDRDGGDADALAVDRVFTQVALVGGADHLLPADLDSRLPAGNLADERGRRWPAPGTLLCVACYDARFEESRRHGLQAQACSTEDTRFGEVFVDTCLGMAAMAQGRVEEAGRRYRRARRGVRKFFSSDPCLTVSTDVLLIELDLERNREKALSSASTRPATGNSSRGASWTCCRRRHAVCGARR